ncbi:MAG: arsenate reductase (glutaredoxin) [Planctomycetes bacterium]|nr:arsenate reductase (glutaredoxin) [Planctomycetota bacterium]MCB9904108.1 arsenate reductase (glutaredoxin) [Planctomycetota bacterium]
MSFDPTRVVFLHNPRCSKSRTVKSLLDEREVQYVERLYLEDPLSVEELAELRHLLDRPAREWIRSGEAAYAEAGLDAGAGEEAHLSAIAAHPILLERPIVVHGGEARVGRPPTAVLELL